MLIAVPALELTYTAPVVATIRGLLGKARQMAAAESPEVLRRVNDVIKCWEKTEQRLTEVKVEAAVVEDDV